MSEKERVISFDSVFLNSESIFIQYVDIIREVAEFYSLPVLDLFASSGLQPKVPVIQEKYVHDGLHPNDAGHKIIADRLTAFLRAL